MVLTRQLQSDFQKKRETLKGRGIQLDSKEASLQTYYSTVNDLRPLFGKSGEVEPDIGNHPDFEHLAAHQTERHYAVTMFMDIASSTRLGLLYPMEDVRILKNAIISKAMEIIRALDGHVHRIMGDAVMAFFGGTDVEPEDGCIDALNAASLLAFYMREVVTPAIKNDGFDADLGIRVGLDYGEEVLWGEYGYPEMNEITATSFYVDVAAKLESAAPRGGVMLGQSLVEFLDLPDELREVKTVQRDGEEKDQRYVLPNHTDADGQPVNYRQWVFDWNEYLTWTKLGQVTASLRNHESLGTVVATEETEDYLPASSALPKGKSLWFRVSLPQLNSGNRYDIEIKRRNFGAEAEAAAERNSDKRELVWKREATRPADAGVYSRVETTKYRGLHYLQIQVFERSAIRGSVRCGVFIK